MSDSTSNKNNTSWLPFVDTAWDLASGIYGIVNNERDFKYQQEIDQFNKDMAEKNYQLAVDQWDWQKEAQETAWSREDTAIRRRVADLEQAGLSKWLAAGQGAQAGGVTASNVSSGANLINSGAKLKDVNLKNAVDSFLTGSERQAGISLTKKQQELVQARIDNEKADTINKTYGADKIVAETQKIYADMQNAVEQINILKKQLDEQISLWDSQKNKNSADADKVKSDIERTAVEIKLKAKEFEAFDTYLEMAKNESGERIQASKSARRNNTANTVKGYIYGLSEEVNKWINPFRMGR